MNSGVDYGIQKAVLSYFKVQIKTLDLGRWDMANWFPLVDKSQNAQKMVHLGKQFRPK